MRTRLAVLAGALLVFSLSGNGYAAAIDKNGSDSADINVICNQDDINSVNGNGDIADCLDNGVDKDLPVDGDKLDQNSLDDYLDLNVEENRGDDNDQLVSDGADPFDSNVLSAADVDDTDNR